MGDSGWSELQLTHRSCVSSISQRHDDNQQDIIGDRVLAHNKVLHPYHKWLLRTVAEVPDRPDAFVDLVRVLAIERTPAAAEAVVMSLLLFREWPQAPAGWSTQFMLDSEWNWLDGEPPIDDL